MSCSVSMESSFCCSVDLVDWMPCCCHFMWPLSVAGDDSGKYCWTAPVVSPGQVGKLVVFDRLQEGSFGRAE
jgi:hypothetical protein